MEAVVFYTGKHFTSLDIVCSELAKVPSCKYSLKQIPQKSAETIQDQFFPLPRDVSHIIFVFPPGDFDFACIYVFIFFAGYCLGKNICAVAVNSDAKMKIPSQFKSIAKFIDAGELSSFLKAEARRLELEKTASDAKQRLLDLGISFFAENFFKCIEVSSEEECRLFLQAGFDANIKDINGNSPLTVAVRCGSLPIVKMLLENGADIDAPSGDRGYSPLMDAVHTKKPEIAEFLLERGANPNARGRDSQTAVCIAAGRGDANECAMLTKYGADPTIPDALGMSAVGYAKLFNNEALCSIFGV